MKNFYLSIIVVVPLLFQSCCTIFNIGCPCPFEQKEWMSVSQTKIDSTGYNFALTLSIAAKGDADSLQQKIKANANLSSEIEMNKFNNERKKEDSKVEVTQEFYQKWTAITAAMCNTFVIIHDSNIDQDTKIQCSKDLREYSKMLANIGFNLKESRDSIINYQSEHYIIEGLPDNLFAIIPGSEIIAEIKNDYVIFILKNVSLTDGFLKKIEVYNQPSNKNLTIDISKLNTFKIPMVTGRNYLRFNFLNSNNKYLYLAPYMINSNHPFKGMTIDCSNSLGCCLRITK
ncbi:MAG: hypothetical protein HW421_1994 [Ignavibacteria bacterium]|nr:hypothetical protein [Ignavibacteria bacterium]